jgi:hypothetical protein
MTAPQCSLCGADILDGTPHESWEWADRDAWQSENPDAPDPADDLGEDDDEPEYLVTLYAHAGCLRVQRLTGDHDWEYGDLHGLVTEWVEDVRTTVEQTERARQAEAAAEGCEYATSEVRWALRKHCDCLTIRGIRTLRDDEADWLRKNAHLGEGIAPTVAEFRARIEKAAADGVKWVEFRDGCPQFSPLTGCPGHGYEWEEAP